MFSRTTVPNLFGTRDQFCGRQFFHRLGTWRVVWDDSSTFIVHFVVAFVQSLSHVRLCDPWTAAHQASLSFAISWSLFKLMTIELVMPSNHLILCCPLILIQPNLQSNQGAGSFVMSHFFASGGFKVLQLQLQHQSFQ